MNDAPDDTLPKRRRSPSRKVAKPPAVANEPAVQAILDQALHPETMPGDALAVADARVDDWPSPKSRPKRKRAGKTTVSPVVEAGTVDMQVVETDAIEAGVIEAETAESGALEAQAFQAVLVVANVVSPAGVEVLVNDQDHNHPDHGQPDHSPMDTAQAVEHDDRTAPVFVEPPADNAPPDDDPPPAATASAEPNHHHWVYLALAVFLLALGFGLWGIWATWFSDVNAADQSAAALRARSDKLSQEVSTLRRSDQISREANRDLERTLAERDEEIAGLRADIAFYERFVGATGQRRGLSVHDLEMQLQSGDVWHFVATLTQNLNRGAVNTGRVMLAVEGTRNDRLEKLSWSGLRKQNNAPGVGYSFKYFQQIEGEVMLPKDFKPLRVTVRLVPAGGSAVEQSFPWPETVRGGG